MVSTMGHTHHSFQDEDSSSGSAPLLGWNMSKPSTLKFWTASAEKVQMSKFWALGRKFFFGLSGKRYFGMGLCGGLNTL